MHHGRLGQRGDVAQILRLLRGDFTQDASHDFTAARFRQRVGEMDDIGRGDGPDALPYVHEQAVAQVGVDDRSLFDGDVGIDALALHRLRVPYDGCFCDLRVRDERAFNFGRADAVARHVHHVVDATRDPEVAILVSIGAIAREVVAGGGEVHVFVSLRAVSYTHLCTPS